MMMMQGLVNSFGKVLVAGEISAKVMPDIPSIVCRTIREAGYTGLDYEIEVITHDQSDDIAHAVREGVQTGAGDQGIMYGFACDETESYLPLPVILAHRLTRLLTNARKTGMIQGLRPDGKAQVSVEYSFDTHLQPAGAVGSALTPKEKNCAISITTTQTCGNGCWSCRPCPTR